MKTELLDGEELLAEELANFCGKWTSVGGRLHVTNRRVIFEPGLLNVGAGVREIPLPEIEDVRPRNTLGFIPNGMEIRTRDGKRHGFVVWGRRRLIDMIHVCKGGVLSGGQPARPPRRTESETPPFDPAIRTGPSVDGAARPRGE